MKKDTFRPGLLDALVGTSRDEAAEILRSLAEVRDLSGAICEFGVAQGCTSALIANEIRDEPTVLHLFDSFQGLPAPSEEDTLLDDIFNLGTMAAYAGQMSCPRAMVEDRLRAIEFPPVRIAIHAGFVADTLREVSALPLMVKFAYVDLDLYEGTRDALAWLDRVAVPGAVVIVDDYDFFSSGAKAAVDEFLFHSMKWSMKMGEHFVKLKRAA